MFCVSTQKTRVGHECFLPLPSPATPPLSTSITSSCLYVEVPMVTLSPSRVTLMEGEKVDLTCTTSGVPSPELIWKMVLVSNYEVRSHTHTHTETHFRYFNADNELIPCQKMIY